MKYKVAILLAVLAVAASLIVGLAIPVSGVVVEQPGSNVTHQNLWPKILGNATFGADNTSYMGVPSFNLHYGSFYITNPNCHDNITLGMMQVIRGWDRTLIYYGITWQTDQAINARWRAGNFNAGTTSNILMPHQTIYIPLAACFPTTAAGNQPAAPLQNSSYKSFVLPADFPTPYIYTLEIQYSIPNPSPQAQPPLGWATNMFMHRYDDSPTDRFVGIDSSQDKVEMKIYK